MVFDAQINPLSGWHGILVSIFVDKYLRNIYQKNDREEMIGIATPDTRKLNAKKASRSTMEIHGRRRSSEAF